MNSPEKTPGLNDLPASVEFDFLFAPHDTAKELEALPDRLAACDIFIPETGPVISGMADLYNRISQGDQAALSAETIRLQQYSGWEGKVFEINQLFNSNKPVALIDPASNSPLWRRIALGALALERTNISDEEYVRAHVEFGKIQRRREDRMLAAIAPAIIGIIRMQPDLGQKENVKALVTLGPVHTRVFHEITKALGNARTSRTISFDFPPELSLIRRGIFGLDTSVEDAYSEIAKYQKRNS